MDTLSKKEKKILKIITYDLLIETVTSMLEEKNQVVLFPSMPLTDPLINYIESKNI